MNKPEDDSTPSAAATLFTRTVTATATPLPDLIDKCIQYTDALQYPDSLSQ